MGAVDALQQWFNELSRDQQEEIVRFLYDGRMLLQEGRYLGPPPGIVTKGLHCGPSPSNSVRISSTSNICPTCGRRL